ncbi:MAG: tetratricopeptide repeat protein [Acidobacteria bacterium]|nr:tetratricopeptide repeat protein [Acidobacteriota bacterium]
MRLHAALWLSLFTAAQSAPDSILIDYPSNASIFPPEITAPTFIWRDPSRATRWRIEVRFQDGGAPLVADSAGEPLGPGESDPRTVSETNQLPALTEEQKTAHGWKPAEEFWSEVKRRSTARPAQVAFAGLGDGGAVLSRAEIRITTSADAVGAPIFYRDVPLMPSETEKGVIKPIAAQAIRLIQWRLRDLSQPESRVVLSGMPTCGNCHSFSLDGKTLGMDLDGPQNHKGIYALAPVRRRMTIQPSDVVEWSTARGRLEGKVRVGFMSQVSPDGRYVATTVSGAAFDPKRDKEPPSNYYVANFTDYRFLQVFYPTQGQLAWYSRETDRLQPLPGADDPRLVQAGAVWSPDGQYLVFARAAAKDPNPAGVPLAQRANDPNELQLRYDLYRIPFNGGQGGRAEPIAGASANGMSNSFPKVSPDGKWLVFVQARNGLLMRPDSQLYIVPATGGLARRMNCNTRLMNSWHSFSPNGRWLVFSSKARSPYTQMYLTHIDENGNDSPAILIDNSTAANRAVNLPEFVHIPPDGLESIEVPAVDSYRLFDTALELQQKGDLAGSIEAWRKVLEANPRDAAAHNHFGMVLFQTGRLSDAERHFRAAVSIRPGFVQARCGLGSTLAMGGKLDAAVKEFRAALAADPAYAPAHNDLGLALLQQSRPEEAIAEFRSALAGRPGDLPARTNLGTALAMLGRHSEAIAELRRAVELDPSHAPAQFNLGLALATAGNTAEAVRAWQAVVRVQPDHREALNQLAWVLATDPNENVRRLGDPLPPARRANELAKGQDPRALDTLAAALASSGDYPAAGTAARAALREAVRDPELVRAISARAALYEAGRPYRRPPGSPALR